MKHYFIITLYRNGSNTRVHTFVLLHDGYRTTLAATAALTHHGVIMDVMKYQFNKLLKNGRLK